jgi:hypothetical protein
MIPSSGGWSVPLSVSSGDPRGIGIGLKIQAGGVSSSYVRRSTEGGMGCSLFCEPPALSAQGDRRADRSVIYTRADDP